MSQGLLRLVRRAEDALQRREDQSLRRRGLATAKRLYAEHSPLRLDLGCGGQARAGFVGVDLCPSADLHWNLCWGLPFPDESVAEIRSDHCLEHLPLKAVMTVLREAHRVLRRGGRLSFTIPHVDPYLDAYRRGDEAFLREKIFDVPAGTDVLYETPFDRIAWLLHRDGEHRSLFDAASIVAKVRRAGFGEAWTREYDAAQDIHPRFSSCYVEAIK